MIKSDIFFNAFVGRSYCKGFSHDENKVPRYPTMILGAHHVCSELYVCSHKQQCCSATEIESVNLSCPYNQKLHDNSHYNLRNASVIEMESYLDIASSSYPSYNDFTRKMLHRRPGFVSIDERHRLWDYVVFNNFLQHYVPGKDTPPYDSCRLQDPILRRKYTTCRAMYDAAIPAFHKMLKTYTPLFIYVWTTSVRDCLLKNIAKLPGLKYEGEVDFDLSSMSVYLFSYNRVNEVLPYDVVQDINMPVRHIVIPENTEVQTTSINELRETEVGKILYDYFDARGKQLSFAELSKMKTAFDSFIKGHGIILLEKGADHFTSNKKAGSCYWRRLMYTCLKNYLGLKWGDLLHLIQGEPNIRNDSPSEKDRNIDLDALENGFYDMMGMSRPSSGRSLLYRFKT